jgi:hypothetical protein
LSRDTDIDNVTTDGDHVYVANLSDDTVSVISV